MSLPIFPFLYSEKGFVSQERVSGFPERGADLRGSLGNFRGSSGNFRGSLGNFRGTSGLLLSSTVRELPGKSPKNFRGSSGNFRGSLGNFPEARGSLTPSQRLAKFVSNLCFFQFFFPVFWVPIFSVSFCVFQGEIIYAPPPLPPFLAKRYFPGEGGWGCIF